MSTRENNFFNPFKNWPFATSPIKAGLITASSECCDCSVIDGNYFNPDGLEARYVPPYPLIPILEFGPSRLPQNAPPLVGARPEISGNGPIGRKSAIDSLRAVKSQKVLKQLKQPVRESVGSGSSNTSNVEKQGVITINSDENKAISQEDTPQNHSTNGHSVTHSTSNPTMTSSRVTSAWGKLDNNSFQSQIALESIEPVVKEPKGKQKADWNGDSLNNSKDNLVLGEASGLQEYLHRKIIMPETPPNQQTSEELAAGASFAKMILGCSQCLFDPKLRVVPCGCLICIACGGRFWSSFIAGNIVYCGCGEQIISILNLQNLTEQAIPMQEHYPYINQWSPAFTSSPVSTSAAIQFSPTPSRLSFSPSKKDQAVPRSEQFISAAARMNGHKFPSVPLPTNSANNITRMLMMDAETAIQNAPFIELGRNALAQNWACVKIGNIPYNVTSEELLEFLGKNANIVPEIAGSVGVHVIMDRSTGKTMDAYVEFITAKDAWKCVSRRRSRVLGNRHLTLEVVDPSDLMKDIFPRAKGVYWKGVIPLPQEDCSELGTKTEIISREELVLIVNHARTPHRSPFSRKCLQRPFQSLMSIVSKFPWFAIKLYTVQQRDFIFHALISAIDILKRQIKRGRTMPNLDIDLLKCLLRIGIRCSGFTDAQKYELVKTAEFGAEGIQVDADIGILSGFEGLGKAVGAERKVLEFYALLLELSVSPFLSEPSNQGLAAAELIRAKNITKQHPEDTKKSHLTMAETAALEWSTIENAVRTVLPSKLQFVKNMNNTNTDSWHEKQKQ